MNDQQYQQRIDDMIRLYNQVILKLFDEVDVVLQTNQTKTPAEIRMLIKNLRVFFLIAF